MPSRATPRHAKAIDRIGGGQKGDGDARGGADTRRKNMNGVAIYRILYDDVDSCI